MERQNTRLLKVLLVLVLMAIVILAVPIAKGYGTALAVENGPGLDAQAGLLRAHADELGAWKSVLESLPSALSQGGSLIVQIALALFVIVMSIGLGCLLLSVSYNFYVVGKIKYSQAQMGAYSNFAPKHNLLPPQIRPLMASPGDDVDISGNDSGDDLLSSLESLNRDGERSPIHNSGRSFSSSRGKTTGIRKNRQSRNPGTSTIGRFLAGLRGKRHLS